MNIFFNRLALNEGDFSYSGHILDAMTSCVFVDRAIENRRVRQEFALPGRARKKGRTHCEFDLISNDSNNGMN